MKKASSPYRVHQCSKCPWETEYYCVSCLCDLCPKCKENHVTDLKTIDHIVVAYCEKIKYTKKKEICERDPNIVYKKDLLPCEHPLCYHCTQHEKYRTLDDDTTASKRKRQQHGGIVYTIRSDALFYRPILMPGIKADFNTCRTELSICQSETLTKSKRLKHQINCVIYDLLNNVFCDFNFKHRCLKQKIEMSRHIISMQGYVEIYEQSAFKYSALEFLSSIKKSLHQIQLTLHTNQLSMTESLNKEDVMESISAIQITERGNRLRTENECLLKLMASPEFHQSLTVTDIEVGLHISCVTSDLAWISDHKYNLNLTNSKGDILRRLRSLCFDDLGITIDYGTHAVNSESELIYINRGCFTDLKPMPLAIKKLSKDPEEIMEFKKNSEWKPRCVYWSPSTGDLLVVMWEYKTKTGKVTRYNQRGQLTQTIEHDNTGLKLYSQPNYITENNNGDIVVSDCMENKNGALVVTERGGRHRFSYKGHSLESELFPRGICTDALSHILVCDGATKTVHILNKDGQFLSDILVKPSGIISPCGLSYDVNTHRLWVGSQYKNNVVIYRYITRQDARTDLNPATANVIRTSEIEEQQQGNQSLLKKMSAPELLHSITVKGVGCYHISCVTSDRVWVSDDRNLISSNTTGVPSHRVWDLRGNLYGLHTVNSESELIYIDGKYNINKLSKDMNTTTIFIERTDSSWRPRCVYWSPSTGDLLVGMYRVKPREKEDSDNTDDTDDTDDKEFSRTSKVTRYNQSGQPTQTIPHDNSGLKLYSKPNYITENNNGDIAVSDPDAIVVTGRGGRHRFSYTGHPSGSGLRPRGICTDALSHILVCDDRTKTVQMMNKDGQFLSHLLTESQEMGEPRSLSYDINTHCLWVGSGDNKVYLYRYITRLGALTDKRLQFPGGDALLSSTPAMEWR